MPDKHVHVTFDFDGLPVHYRDIRKFGRLTLVEDGDRAGGPGPRGPGHDDGEVRRVAAADRRAQGAHQGAAAGPGHRRGTGQHLRGRVAVPGAAFTPRRGPATWTTTTLREVLRRGKQVLRLAINHGGTTFLNFSNFYGKPGNFRRKLRVYGRGGRALPGLRDGAGKDRGRRAGDGFLSGMPGPGLGAGPPGGP